MQSRTKFDTPEELIEAFCRFATELGNSPQTVQGRRSDLRTLVRWYEAQCTSRFDLSVFVTKEFESYRDWLQTRVAPSTANRRLNSLNLFLNWSVQRGLLHPRALPTIKTKKNAPRAPAKVRCLSEYEISQLLGAARKYQDLRYVTILTLLARTGIRISDICSLRWEDLSIRQNEGTIRLERKKFGRRVRLPILDSDTRQALLSWQNSGASLETGWVFEIGEKPLTRRTIEMLISRCAQMASLGKVTAKTLRYSFLMNLVLRGTDPHILAVLGGFERVEMTRRFYEVEEDRSRRATS